LNSFKTIWRKSKAWFAERLSMTLGVLLFFTLVIAMGVRIFPYLTIEGDTVKLLNGLARATQGAGKFGWEQLHYFSPLQHLIAVVAINDMNFFYDATFIILTSSLASFFIVVFGGFFLLRRLQLDPISWMWFLTCFSSPLIVYARTTFVESLAAGLNFLCVVAIFSRSKIWAVFIPALLAGLSKETAPLMVFTLGVFALALRPKTEFDRSNKLSAKQKVSPELIALTAASLIADILNKSFNMLRYATIENSFYSHDLMQVSSVEQYFTFLYAGFFSMNGGIFFHWPAVILILLGLILAKTTGKIQIDKDDNRIRFTIEKVKPFVPFVFLFAVLAGFSIWHAPFGWISWSNRLSLPWVIPALWLTLAAFGVPILKVFAEQKHPVVRIALMAFWLFLTVIGISHVIAFLYPDRSFVFVGAPTSVCPTAWMGFWPNPIDYYDCVNSYMLDNNSVLSKQWTLIKRADDVVIIVLYSIAMAFSGFMLAKSFSKTAAHRSDGNLRGEFPKE